MATIHGKDALIYLQGSGNEAVVLVEQADYSIDMDFDTDDTTELGGTWGEAVKGILKWSGSLSGNFDPASRLLWDASLASTARKFYLYPLRTSLTQYYYGTTWVKLGNIIAGGVGSKSKSSSSLIGDGPLTPSL